MQETILRLSAISVLYGLIISLCPEGGYKKIANILCTAVLVLCILKPLEAFNFDSFTTDIMNLQTIENDFLEQNKELDADLNKMVIKQQCEEYILNLAGLNGVQITNINITLGSLPDGVWIPSGLDIRGKWNEQQIINLQNAVEDKLGILKERQCWQSE